jgi:peptidyl-dipeptidase Dcp
MGQTSYSRALEFVGSECLFLTPCNVFSIRVGRGFQPKAVICLENSMGTQELENNPLLKPFSGPEGCIPYKSLNKDHFLPAIDWGIEKARERLKLIQSNTESVSFENTALALESLSEELDLAAEVYFNLFSAEADEALQSLAKEISPKLAAFSNDISLDPQVFMRVKSLHDKRQDLGLTPEQIVLIEKQYKGFVRNGALLNDKDKEELRRIDKELSTLGPQFSENVLKATNAYILPLKSESELEGLPASAIEALEQTAKERKVDARWAVSLDVPVFLPFMKHSKRRDLREQVNKAFAMRAVEGEWSNAQILKSIASLRHERAQLLGFKTHADYVLAERMAGSAETVMNFLNRILKIAKPKALEDVEELRAIQKEMGGGDDLRPWDVAYYSERLLEKKYALDEEELRPYFKLENVVDGAFRLAEKLFDIRFEKVTDIPVYHPDVTVYRVSDLNKNYVGLFYTDFFSTCD